MMIGYLTLVFCAAAGLIGAPWSITIAAAIVLSVPIVIRHLQLNGVDALSMPVFVLPSFALNALFAVAAFMLGHGTALLWLA